MEGVTFIHEHFNKMNCIQEMLLDFFENEGNEKLVNIVSYFDSLKIRENQYQFKEILLLITRISDNHNQCNNLLDKIFLILKDFANEIKKYFSNFEIFDIFKNNKRILLFLFEKKNIIPDNSIFCIIMNEKYKKRFYPQYFYNEFKSFFNEEMVKELNFNSKCDGEFFDQKRKEGENDTKICQLIRNESIQEFIVYINQLNINISKNIAPSIYETNLFLLKNDTNLIEYAAFYGSIQIFQYLNLNQVKLNQSLCNSWQKSRNNSPS